MFCSPAVANGVVYVGSWDGNFYALGNQLTPTALIAVAAPTKVAINKPFVLTGTLKTTDGTPIAGATIQLQKNVGGMWTNVALKTATTMKKRRVSHQHK
jgi:hypothetical protein